MDFYGLIITAQMLAGYASKIIDFGSNSVCAKHVSINRNDKDKLSEVVCSVLSVRSILWVICFCLYFCVVMLVPTYREYKVLFILSYGLTFNDILFPQYFFQGIEKMKYITIINISVKLLFIVLIFLVVKDKSDYLYVPVFYTIGYLLAGLVALWTIFKKMAIKFKVPNRGAMMVYVKDSSAIFATDLICTIKDRFNYFFIGGFAGMANVVVYDLGVKINSLLVKPMQIISTVLFPRFAKSRDTKMFKKILMVIALLEVVIVLLVNVFLPWIVDFFIDKPIDLMPLRLFTLAPIMLSVSSFVASNLFVAFGYNKYVLYSILITTATYIVSLLTVHVTHTLDSVYSFVIVALASYFSELLYRIIKANIILKKETNR